MWVVSISLLLSACGGGSETGTGTTSTSTGSGTSTGGTGSTSGNSSAIPTNYKLYIQSGSLNIGSSPDTGNGVATLQGWGYSANATSSATAKIIPGVLLEARTGQTFTVNIKNSLSDPHGFEVPNLSSTELSSQTFVIAQGKTVRYTLTPKNAGIYLYQDAGAAGVNSAVGLFGALIVRPDKALGNVVWNNGPSFDKEVLWVIADMDNKGWNQVALDATRGVSQVNTSVYKPDYFLMNGMNGFRAMDDPNTQISGRLGEKILVRIVNAGQYAHSLHFHGNHFEVLSQNGIRQTHFDKMDTINIKPKQTAIILYTVTQVGHYPMHVHTAQMETSHGVYLNGVAAMIIGKL